MSTTTIRTPEGVVHITQNEKIGVFYEAVSPDGAIGHFDPPEGWSGSLLDCIEEALSSMRRSRRLRSLALASIRKAGLSAKMSPHGIDVEDPATGEHLGCVWVDNDYHSVKVMRSYLEHRLRPSTRLHLALVRGGILPVWCPNRIAVIPCFGSTLSA